MSAGDDAQARIEPFARFVGILAGITPETPSSRETEPSYTALICTSRGLSTVSGLSPAQHSKLLDQIDREVVISIEMPA